jgi:hypothetical protein
MKNPVLDLARVSGSTVIQCLVPEAWGAVQERWLNGNACFRAIGISIAFDCNPICSEKKALNCLSGYFMDHQMNRFFDKASSQQRLWQLSILFVFFMINLDILL